MVYDLLDTLRITMVLHAYIIWIESAKIQKGLVIRSLCKFQFHSNAEKMINRLLDDVYKDHVTLEVNNDKFLHNGNQNPNWPQINWLKLHNMDFELIFSWSYVHYKRWKTKSKIS